jgi:membrane-associated phospholipid phosphatase
LVSYGVLSFAIHPIRNLDYTINNEITKTAPNFSSKAESYFQYAPIAIVYGLNLAGISGKNTFIDRTALLGISAIMAGIATTATKYATHRLRPNGSDNLSFFSGHTTTAFAGAEFLNQEYSDRSVWYSVAGYTIATATGVFRLYNHDHWFSDVVAGAGAGMLCTKAAYFVYPYLRNQLTHKGTGAKEISFMPTYQDGNIGFSFAMQL